MKVHVLTHPDLDLDQISLKVNEVRAQGGVPVVVNQGQDAPLDEHCADLYYYVHADGQAFSNRGRRVRCVPFLEGKDLENHLLNSLVAAYGEDSEFIFDDVPVVVEKVVEEVIEEEVIEEEAEEDELLHEHEDGTIHSHEGGDEDHEHEENLEDEEDEEDSDVSDDSDSSHGSNSGLWAN